VAPAPRAAGAGPVLRGHFLSLGQNRPRKRLALLVAEFARVWEASRIPLVIAVPRTDSGELRDAVRRTPSPAAARLMGQVTATEKELLWAGAGRVREDLGRALVVQHQCEPSRPRLLPFGVRRGQLGPDSAALV
jgi:hypothetical protein